MKKDSICQVDVINQQNVITATNYLEKEKVQKSLRILSKFTDNKQINIIFYLLAVEELCVCDIACLLNLSMASASHHLRKLANQNILDTRREGKIIYYFIKDDSQERPARSKCLRKKYNLKQSDLGNAGQVSQVEKGGI